MQATFVRVLLSLVVVGGCSGGDADSPDAGSDPARDGSIDSSDAGAVDGPAIGAVDVFAVGWTDGVFGPLDHVPVVAFHPDGSVDAVLYTDSSGHVAAMIEARSLIAVINGEHRGDVHVDAAIASPGQTLRFGGTIGASTPIGTLSLSWPARVFPGGYTVYYDVITPCGGYETTATSMQIQLTQECAPGPFDVAVTSRRSSQPESAWMLRRAVAPAANVAVNFGDDGATWELVDRAFVTVTNAPVGFDSASCFSVQYLGQRAFNRDTATVREGQCDVPVMPGGDTLWNVEVGWRRAANNVRVTMRRTMASDTTAAIDGVALLPWPTSLTYEPSTRQVAWTSGPAPVDASRLQLRTLNGSVSWQIWIPDGLPPTWTLPSLPAAFAEWDFAAGDEARLMLLNTDVAGEDASYLLAHDLYFAPVISGQVILTSEIASY